LGKIGYGSLFTIVLPVLLAVWAVKTESIVNLPVVKSTPVGLVVLLIGIASMLAGIAALYVYAQALPMNAFPPTLFVAKGIYHYLSHPIYLGFGLLCVGISIIAGSSSGLWFVTPMVVLGCVALVLGHEQHDLKSRFGPRKTPPLLAVPPADADTPSAWNRFSVYVLLFAPWVMLYEAVVKIGAAPDAFTVFLPFERNLPVFEWTEAIYVSVYLFVLAAPLVARTQQQLREFMISGLIASGAAISLYCLIPVVASPREFEPAGLLGRLLMLERQYDAPVAAFPSFHVMWAFLAARLYVRALPKGRLIWYGLALAISISSITTGMHAILDAVAGVVCFLVIAARHRVWQVVLRTTERLANSWREWRFGPIRIINHAIFPGLAAFVGLLIVGILSPAIDMWGLLLVTLSLLLGGAIWAQLVEGSSSLLRPFGYYGALIGVAVGILLASLRQGLSPWGVLSAFAVAAPFVQLLGRLRCIVQGCCHGRKSSSDVSGIRHWNPHSRVTRIAGLNDIPIYPTPLYSIVWNIVIGAILLRFYFLSVPSSFVVGNYFLLAGIGRFVEESYRGEPQTRIVAGLRLYQWLSVCSVLIGGVVSCCSSPATDPLICLLSPFAINLRLLAVALVGALLSAFAMSIDFPNSTKRFSRLTS